MLILRYWAVCSLTLSLTACGPSNKGLGPGEERLSDREAENTAAMIEAIEAISIERSSGGLMKRFNQSKTLGCFDATFTVREDLATELNKGVFIAGRSYRAQIRIASATQEDDREKDFRGLSIKLSEVNGDSLWGEPGKQDFLFNSYPALFAANPDDFLDFILATQSGQLWRYFINPSHLYSLGVVLKGREEIKNPFAIRYWSTTPYRFGDNTAQAVKYSLTPCPGVPELSTKEHEHFLSDAMAQHLGKAPACFEFAIQFQSDPNEMPIENAAVIWDEVDSPFVPLATLLIEPDATRQETLESCEDLTFNPWQSLAAHRPIGGINRTRKPIYSEIGEFRLRHNSQSGN